MNAQKIDGKVTSCGAFQKNGRTLGLGHGLKGQGSLKHTGFRATVAVIIWALGTIFLAVHALAQHKVPRDADLIAQLKENAARFEYSIGKPGGTLTLSTISGPKTFNLAISTETSSTQILDYVFEGLVQTSWLTAEVEPALAERWESSEDGLVWTFFLRKDVRWADGAPFSADDVVFTFSKIIYNDAIPASARPGLTIRYRDDATQAWKKGQLKVEKIDDHTVSVTLPVPFAPFLRAMGTSIYPKHILEKHVDDGTFTSTWDVGTEPGDIIGTGPFVIERYDAGERIVLKRNPRYWQRDAAGNALPYLDRIVHLVVPNQATALLKFQAGETDFLQVPGEHYPILKPQEAAKNFTLYKQGPNFGTTFLALNMNAGKNPNNDAPFVDPVKLNWFRTLAFRKAVAHSIDKDSIIDNVMNGLGYPQWAAVSPAAGDFHNPNVTRYPYDIGKANALLDGLGWYDVDGDGVREDAEGNRLVFNLATNSGNTVRERVCTLLKQDLERIGVRVNLRFLEFNKLVSQLTSTYDWEAIVIGFTGGVEPHHGINFWHSSERLHLWFPNQEVPATEWEKRIDDLFVRGSRELAHRKRVALYREFQQIASDHVPVVYTALAERITALRNRFGNVTPTLFDLFDARRLYLE